MAKNTYGTGCFLLMQRVFHPTMSRDEAAARMAGWERAVRQATSG
jgi:glycerol kinase